MILRLRLIYLQLAQYVNYYWKWPFVRPIGVKCLTAADAGQSSTSTQNYISILVVAIALPLP